MSDVSKTNELIAEAQQHYSEMNGLNSRAAEVMMELVAALEAKTGVRVPGMDDVLAALDGAPEPEWGWGVCRTATGNCWPVEDIHEAREAAVDGYHVVRRRPFTPWLPVEGESDD